MADGSTRRERVRGLLNRELLHSIPMRGPVRRSSVVEAGAWPPDARPSARAAHDHVVRLALDIRPLLGDEDASDELLDLGVACAAAAQTIRRPLSTSEHTRDIGSRGARVARCAAEALRTQATLEALPAGAAVPDVPPPLLWRICDLSTRLRATGREGRLGVRWDAGVEARDAADRVVTTYRRWHPRLRGDTARRVSRLALAAADVAIWCGFASIDVDDDDCCGRPVEPVVSPPTRSAAAEAAPPAAWSPVHAVATA